MTSAPLRPWRDFREKLSPKTEFGRHVFALLIGASITQAIPVLISPLLTRLYTPESWGLFSQYVAIVSTIACVASGRYEQVIMLPRSNRNAFLVAMLGFLIACVVSLGVGIVIFAMTWIKLKNAAPPKLVGLYWVPISVLVASVYQLLLNWNSRNRRHHTISKNRVLQSLISACIQLLSGIMGKGGNGLVIGQFFGQLVACFGFLIRRNSAHNPYGGIFSYQRLLALARRYKGFPLVSGPSALLNTASTQLPIVIMATLFNGTVVGFFSLGHRVISLPMTLIGNAVGQVYFQNAALWRETPALLRQETVSLNRRLMNIGWVPSLIILVAGDHLFAIVFGEPWRTAGIYAQVMMPWMFFVFISSPLSHLFTVFEKHRASVAFNAMLFASRMGVLIIGAKWLSVFHTVLLYGVVGAIFWAVFVMYLLALVGVRVIDTVKGLLPYIAIACFAVGMRIIVTTFLLG